MCNVSATSAPAAKTSIAGATGGGGGEVTSAGMTGAASDEIASKLDEPVQKQAPEPVQSEDAPKGGGEVSVDRNHGWYVSQAAHTGGDVQQVAQSNHGMPVQSKRHNFA